MKVKIPYNIYKKHKGGLTCEQFKQIRDYSPLQNQIDLSKKCLINAAKFNNTFPPENDDIIAGASLIGTLKEKIPKERGSNKLHNLWLYNEALILTGKI